MRVSLVPVIHFFPSHPTTVILTGRPCAFDGFRIHPLPSEAVTTLRRAGNCARFQNSEYLAVKRNFRLRRMRLPCPIVAPVSMVAE